MNLKDIIQKNFLFESKKADVALKIFYKFNINIIKAEDKPADNPPADNPPADATAIPADNPPADATAAPVDNPPADATAAPVDNPPVDMGVPEPRELPASEIDYNPSVVTEDEKIEINDDNNIVRKMEGEISLSKEKVDEIQCIEDLINILTEEKNEGITILDEFSADLLTIMLDPNQQNQIKEKISKKSDVYTEIKYGKDLNENVGVRLIKRKNSEMLTTSMLVDNQILNAKFSKDLLDRKITNFRNAEYD